MRQFQILQEPVHALFKQAQQLCCQLVVPVCAKQSIHEQPALEVIMRLPYWPFISGISSFRCKVMNCAGGSLGLGFVL